MHNPFNDADHKKTEHPMNTFQTEKFFTLEERVKMADRTTRRKIERILAKAKL